MRKILFLGKCNEVGKYNGQWIEGFYGEDDGKPIIARSTDHGLIGYFCEPDSIGQYTGLTDKNGKKIFEGDICNISIPRIDGGFNRHNKCLCSYEGGMYKFSSYSDIYLCMGNGYGYPDTCHQNIEVIGNIHDNPELLEVVE